MDRSQVNWRFWITLAVVLALTFVVMGLAFDRYQKQVRIGEFTERFELLSTLRREALKQYLDTVRTEITFWSLSEDLIEIQANLSNRWQQFEADGGDAEKALRELYVDNNPHGPGRYWELTDAGDGSYYSEAHSRLHPLASLFVVERGYFDFFLIDPQGNVFYTVEKESDYGTNLLRGPWKETHLASAFRRALEHAGEGKVVFSDFAPYAPSGDAAAMFAARAMLGEEDQVIGVLALQLPTKRIQDIMQFTAGMGDTGETYLVGEDLLMRSDSRFSETSTILRTKVDTETVHLALDGQNGAQFTDDYRGVRVLSAYTSVEIDDFAWAIVAEIDEAEVETGNGGDRKAFTAGLALMYSLFLSVTWLVGSGRLGGGGMGGFGPDLGDLHE